jgi:phenylalanyl-tRNA synthetase beta chain
MKLSLNWLKEYVNLPPNLAPSQLAYDLTMSTVEVEEIKNQASMFDKIVVGKIIEIKKHPNADKLHLVFVDVGEKLQVVCGGTNLQEGMLVAVALIGAKVRWHGEGDLVEMVAAEIRGEKSFGMICSSNEIGLQDKFPGGEKEILDLGAALAEKKLLPGQPLAEVLASDEMVIEIDNKSLTNRPDLWNHYGLARELSAIYKTKFKFFDLEKLDKEIKKLRNKEIKEKDLEIKILDKDLCDRYIGCMVKNIKIEPSPAWLTKKLEAVGVRSINNIVDITNYVMFDVGEPMHAFDTTKLHHAELRGSENNRGTTRKIIVRGAKKGEKIMSLDGVERKLDETMLVIADEKKPIALAGIMGGEHSGVDENTVEIIFEAAHFNAVNIRKTSQKLGLRSESSIRFEKNLDVHLAELGMLRALALIKQILPQAEIGPLVDENYVKENKIKI